jgi:hypothetical protein
MVTGEATHLEIDPASLGTLELNGFEVPYVDLEDLPAIRTRLRLRDTEYVYERTFPLKGHSAVMPAAVAELRAKGKRILVVERKERYYVYVA